jgi:hypothetical protein
MRSILIGLFVLVFAGSVFARGPVHVRGYTTKSGRYVAPHYRSAPDHSRWNNWSTRGNVNPYTGKVGTKDPYGSSYGYSAPNYGYSAPSYGYSSPSYGVPAQGYGRAGGSATPTPLANGEILLASGAVKVPAKTSSGYCLRAPPDYVGTGDLNYPALSGAMPRCEGVVE